MKTYYCIKCKEQQPADLFYLSLLNHQSRHRMSCKRCHIQQVKQNVKRRKQDKVASQSTPKHTYETIAEHIKRLERITNQWQTESSMTAAS